MKSKILALALVLALALASCGGSSSSTSSASERTEVATERSKPKVVVPQGPAPKKLVAKELIKGTGAIAETGDEVTVQYVGVDYKTGKQFDASWDRGEPFTFTLGQGEVIPGWDQGVVGMRVGGRRELIVPSKLAYGPEGRPPVIAPNATLLFVIDLLAVK